MTPEERDRLGRIVREAWCAYARTLPNPRPLWSARWEDTPEEVRETSRAIGEAVADALASGGRAAIREAAVAEEREACALIADMFDPNEDGGYIAEAIRAREKP